MVLLTARSAPPALSTTRTPGVTGSLALSGTGRQASIQLSEHFAQAPVHVLEDSPVLGHRQVRQLVEPG
jgi:hypothetical protein